MTTARIPEPERFWPKVRKTAKCWLWTAAVNNWGYGRFQVWRDDKWKTIGAHVWAWEQENGPVPEGDWEVDHLCNNKRCVRPSHLKLVTPKENKGRWLDERTHCFNGHPLHGERRCGECREAAEAVGRVKYQERKAG